MADILRVTCGEPGAAKRRQGQVRVRRPVVIALSRVIVTHITRSLYSIDDLRAVAVIRERLPIRCPWSGPATTGESVLITSAVIIPSSVEADVRLGEDIRRPHGTGAACQHRRTAVQRNTLSAM
jgi:hypothetical protein